MNIDIIQLASLIGAVGAILGVIIGGYKFIDGQRRANEKNALEIKHIKAEQTVICYAMSACLDGLEQLGANHTVPKAKEELDKHLNKAAHDEE